MTFSMNVDSTKSFLLQIGLEIVLFSKLGGVLL